MLCYSLFWKFKALCRLKTWHIVEDTCLVSGEHYYSAITYTKRDHCSLHWRLPSSRGKNELRQVHLSPSCLLRSTKNEKRGKQMAKQINYRKKNHVTCQIYTLFYVAVSFLPVAHIFKIEFWKPNTLLKPFMLHQFTEVDSFFCSCFDEPKSNKHGVCLWHWGSFLILPSESQCLMLSSTGSPLNSQWGEKNQNKREREKSSINHTSHLSHSTKKPHDVGLRGRTDSTTVANWEKLHMKSFHIRSD